MFGGKTYSLIGIWMKGNGKGKGKGKGKDKVVPVLNSAPRHEDVLG
jgi:hypothetical protein